MKMASYLYDVSFWVVVNLFLAIAVIGLVLIKYSMERSAVRVEKVEKKPSLVEYLDLFEKLAQQGDFSKAVSETFARLFKKLCELNGFDPRFSTPMEVIEGGKLPEHIRQALTEMYAVYEPVRYGLKQPSNQEMEVFRRTLSKLLESV
ncbi:MAG: hypothetical protein QXX49_04615 [Candidatus Caldarchaeum sp.]